MTETLQSLNWNELATEFIVCLLAIFLATAVLKSLEKDR